MVVVELFLARVVYGTRGCQPAGQERIVPGQERIVPGQERIVPGRVEDEPNEKKMCQEG